MTALSARVKEQMFFIGFIEDARVEYLAYQEFPGLRKLWLDPEGIRRLRCQIAAPAQLTAFSLA